MGIACTRKEERVQAALGELAEAEPVFETNKDVKSALRLHNEIMKISSVIYSGSDYGSSNVINGIKYVLHCLGICSDYIAKPLKKISTEKATIIKKFIEENHIIVDK